MNNACFAINLLEKLKGECMAIAQMNWGRMRFPLSDPRMVEFADALEDVYRLAEVHHGFIWRIPDSDAEQQLSAMGHDDRTSATVSVWESVDALKDYTFQTRHGAFLKRANEWFENVCGPQLVLWNTEHADRPTFREAFERLEQLKKHGDTSVAYGWPR